MTAVPRLVISAVRGGLGKTTLSLGITAAWRKQGRRIAVFKKGPDFIDAGWLGVAAGRPCYNLDLYMMEPERIRRSFAEHAAGADAVVIEGNRGLYDGVDESGAYSTARLSKLLKTPVVLIVDGTKASATVAAVILGLQQYDEEIAIGGVILNNVSASRHETVIRKAIAKSSGLPVVGVIPRMLGNEFPERHMGLTPFHEHPEVEQAIQSACYVVQRYVDLGALWNIAQSASETGELDTGSPAVPNRKEDEVIVGVIRDKAFQFYYPDNLEDLERHGAQIREINALRDRDLPHDIDALYIGGGFPETQAAELAANASFCASVRLHAQQGLPIYAECGGLIYLGRSLSVGTHRHVMTGVLPVDFVLEKKPQAHGYTVLETSSSSLFLDKGVSIRGHEFHYSRVERVDGRFPMAYYVTRGYGINGSEDGFVQNNIIAAYTHIHALATPQWAPAMIKKAREYKALRREA